MENETLKIFSIRERRKVRYKDGGTTNLQSWGSKKIFYKS